MNKSLLFALLITVAPLGTQPSIGKTNAPVLASGLAELAQKAGGDASAWVRAANALMQSSRDSSDPALIDKAGTAYESALTLDPKNVDAMVGIAWVYNSRHEFAEGIRWAKKAIAEGAKDHMPYSLLGDAAVELGNYEEAFEYYQTGLDRSPNLSTYSRAAHLLWLTGNELKGRMFMQKAIDSGGPHPENAAWCRAELALMLFNTGALLPADQQIERALKQAPENHHVLYVAGKIKAAEKQFDQAIDFLEKSVSRNNGHGNHDAMLALGDLYSFLGRKEQADKMFQQIVSMHTTAHAHNGGAAHLDKSNSGNAQLARFYADHDRDLDEALRQAELAYRAFPNVFVTTTLAWCYYKKGNYAEANKIIRKALRFGTPDAGIYFRAGMIAAKLDDQVTAQKQLAKALNLNPNFHPGEAKTASDTLRDLSVRRSSDTTVANSTLAESHP
jgi:tetratricopeptide (TPR) repeat protein